jgi:hypothetical protein
MSRTLRIDNPDAWYLVMNHDRRGEKIFLGDYDYRLFLKVLEEAVELCQVYICYMIELLRYICFNPVKAGMVSTPETYSWSCFNEYQSKKQNNQWLNRDLILERF